MPMLYGQDSIRRLASIVDMNIHSSDSGSSTGSGAAAHVGGFDIGANVSDLPCNVRREGG